MTRHRSVIASAIAAIVAIGTITTAPTATAESNAPAVHDSPLSLNLSFKFHVDDGIAEQDVYIERVPGSGQVFRPTKAERKLAGGREIPQGSVRNTYVMSASELGQAMHRPVGRTCILSARPVDFTGVGRDTVQRVQYGRISAAVVTYQAKAIALRQRQATAVE